MNMYRHEFKNVLKSTLIWTLSIMAITIFFFSMYPTFSEEAESLKRMLEGFPDALLQALNFNITAFTSILGFYSYIFVYISLAGAIQAMVLGTGIASREIREKTADFLLTKPVTRQSIMTSKLLAAFTAIIITNAGYLSTAYLMAVIVETEGFSQGIFFMISLSLFFIQLIFLSVGVITAVLISRLKAVLPVSLGTVFAFFVINMFSKSIGDEKMGYFTPFHYFDSMYILQHETYNPSNMILAFVLVVLLIISSYVVYTKKDIHTI
ncbi:MAG: ABC transporter permease subunit [Bacillaceae bacterium]|nr:ABC transporter permease subunit [Bacillaceae bacterium]